MKPLKPWKRRNPELVLDLLAMLCTGIGVGTCWYLIAAFAAGPGA
ncbi:hypothetical protein [Ralstonia insidiosa]|nr:hypothetical protein [Ralstonia insidiosa]